MLRMLKYIISFICCLAFVSCQDDVADADRNSVRIIFTLSVPETQTESRVVSVGTDDTSAIENTIDKERLHIVFYDNQGKYIAMVEHLTLLKESETLYKVVGAINISDQYLINQSFTGKVMVYANIDGEYDHVDYTSDAISLLSYNYSPTAINIPMWGVKTLVNAQLIPGSQVDIGVVNLLRAEAKVYVCLRQDMIDSGFSLSKVMLSQYNTMGYCLPKLENYQDLDDTGNLMPDNYANFYYSQADGELDMTNKVVYVPEYQNQGGDANATVIKLKLRDKKGQETDYTLPFVKYVDGVPSADVVDLVRNHYYKFEVYKGSNGKLQVNLVVRKWWEKNHQEILM